MWRTAVATMCFLAGVVIARSSKRRSLGANACRDARDIAGGPRLVLLDEPSEGLAPQIVEDVAEFLRRLRGEGLSLLLVEQTLNFALKLADQVALLNTGYIVFASTCAEAQSPPDLLQQTLGLH